jgi:RNA polymerase sigma-70 factor (ECF subfamily)
VNSRQQDHIRDAELLELYHKDGNGEWLGILLQRYTLLLLGICMKYLKNEEEAKDCVQQIFLKVLSEAGKYKIDYFKSWLYMVAKNHCLMQLRNKQGKSIKELADDDYPSIKEEDKNDLLADEETYTLLEEAIKELNEEQRQCVTLFYLQKNSYQQIVDKTDYSLLQVKSYIQNGKRNLKLLLEKKMKEKGSAKK